MYLIAIIDGHPALQDELTGTEKGTNVVFLHTPVDNGDHFRQIFAWTLKSHWQQPRNYPNFPQREVGVIFFARIGRADREAAISDAHRSLTTTASPWPPNIGVDVPKPVAVNPCPYTFPLTELLDTDPTYCLFVPRTISPFPPSSCARRAMKAITAPRRLRTGAVSAFKKPRTSYGRFGGPKNTGTAYLLSTNAPVATGQFCCAPR
jgi:hypothetical protein